MRYSVVAHEPKGARGPYALFTGRATGGNKRYLIL
jgi:hypothetical protein